MDAFLAYIGEHWLEWVFAVCLAILTAAWRTVSARLKVEHEKNKAIAEGVQALLRENIVGNYNKYLAIGCYPIYAKESVKKAYAAYSALGGNDVATSLYKKILEMPEEKKEDKT